MSSPVAPTYDCYDSIGNPIKARLMDAMEPPGYNTSLTTTPIFFRRAAKPVWGNDTMPLLESTIAWAISNRFQGFAWAQATSAAATRKTRATTRLQAPMGEDMTLQPASSRVNLRYQFEMVIWRTTPLIALAPLSMAYLGAAGAQFVLEDTTEPGYELISRSDLNGGRWTARARFVSAGPISVLQDTGLDPTIVPYIHAAIRYDHQLIPRLSCFVNGTEYGVLTGIANMPASSNSLQSFGICQGLSVGGGVGQIDRTRQCRIYIEEI